MSRPVRRGVAGLSVPAVLGTGFRGCLQVTQPWFEAVAQDLGRGGNACVDLRAGVGLFRAYEDTALGLGEVPDGAQRRVDDGPGPLADPCVGIDALPTTGEGLPMGDTGAQTPRERYRAQVQAEIKERAWE